MEKLGFKRAVPASTGRPPYDPKVLLKLYLYGYLNRIRSSRRLEDETKRNLEVIWLLKKLSPDFKTIADFRKDNKEALKRVFRDFTRLCMQWDLFGRELVAVDSSKFRASNSKRNNYNAKKLKRHIRYIEEKIDSYIKQLEKTDADEEDIRPLSAEEIKDKIKELRNRKKQYEELEEKLKKSGQKETSLTDPDARLMSVSNQYNVQPSYNVQTTVDEKHKLILDFKVTQNQMLKMLKNRRKPVLV
ncbi:MAG: transposase [Tepidanaerobacteraceae bacterium]